MVRGLRSGQRSCDSNGTWPLAAALSCSQVSPNRSRTTSTAQASTACPASVSGAYSGAPAQSSQVKCPSRIGSLTPSRTRITGGDTGAWRPGGLDAVHSRRRHPAAGRGTGPRRRGPVPPVRHRTAGHGGGRGAARLAAGAERPAGTGRPRRRRPGTLPGVPGTHRGPRPDDRVDRAAPAAGRTPDGARRCGPGRPAQRGEAREGPVRGSKPVRHARRRGGHGVRRRRRPSRGRRQARARARRRRRPAGPRRRHDDHLVQRGRRRDRPGLDPNMTVKTVRVLVADDHPIVLDGVTLALQATSWLQVAGYARNGADAITAVERFRPDVVLLDLRLPDMLGPEVIRALLAVHPTLKIVLFTAYPDHAALGAALAAGAHGAILKDTERADLVDVIRRVVAGERVVSTGVSADS